jgi:hypothetical protein
VDAAGVSGQFGGPEHTTDVQPADNTAKLLHATNHYNSDHFSNHCSNHYAQFGLDGLDARHHHSEFDHRLRTSCMSNSNNDLHPLHPGYDINFTDNSGAGITPRGAVCPAKCPERPSSAHTHRRNCVRLPGPLPLTSPADGGATAATARDPPERGRPAPLPVRPRRPVYHGKPGRSRRLRGQYCRLQALRSVPHWLPGCQTAAIQIGPAGDHQRRN